MHICLTRAPCVKINFCISMSYIHVLLSGLTLLMLETEYSGLFSHYHACWCPGSLSLQGINRHGIDSIGRQHVGLLHCEFGLLLLNKTQDMMQNVNTSLTIFKIIQHVKGYQHFGKWCHIIARWIASLSRGRLAYDELMVLTTHSGYIHLLF